MNVRFEPHEDDHGDLCSLVNLLTDEQGFQEFLVRVRLREGRELFGTYETIRGEVFAVANPWPSSQEGDHGWVPGEKGLVVDPQDVVWLEYVSEASPERRMSDADARPPPNPSETLASGPDAGQAAAFDAAPPNALATLSSTQHDGRLKECEDDIYGAGIAVEAAVLAAAVELASVPADPEASARLRLAVSAMLALQDFVEGMRRTGTFS